LPSNFLTKRLVLAIHRDQLESFGGRPGLRDESLLESALEQPRVTFEGELLHPTVFDQAAAYLFHIAQNHPFVDGNKRVAFAAMDVFLRLNGYVLKLPDDRAYQLVMDAASGDLQKNDIGKLLRSNCEPIEAPDS
jgi:death-on-curing protein